MAGEFLVFKRCCICLPLRYGLLAWGYSKLLVELFLIVGISITLYSEMTTPTPPSEDEILEISSKINAELIIILILGIVILVTDFVLSAAFVIGGHMKNVKIVRIYYFHSIAIWVATLVLTILMLISSIISWTTFDGVSMRFWISRFLEIPSYFLSIVIQTYFLILLRSEIIKLTNNCQFRFVNNAAESEVMMKYVEEVGGEEKGIESVENGTL